MSGHTGATVDVVLVVMPFADIGRPAIGVSLLKAAAERDGFSVHVEYLNLRYAERIGAELYSSIADTYPAEMLVGEWLFAADLFGADIPPTADYVERIFGPYAPGDAVAAVLAARLEVAPYLDAAAAAIAARRPKVVGFMSTFHQTCPSLAVARRLKAGAEPPVILFGGANCEGEMGSQLLASFPVVDYVCSGESDTSFVALLRQLFTGRAPDRAVVESPPIEHLDGLPYPDYGDYFAQMSPAQAETIPRQLAVETARGCWWGAKKHCTFCGLNGATLAFRSKSPDRAYDEITTLCRRYGTATVNCVDNILDPAYIETLFPRLAESDLEFRLFYEVKSNLHYDELVRLRDGGVRHIQPGIESFSDDVLRRMRKGVTGFQNIQLLRWCAELGIDCSWNILAGFPGEPIEEYEWIAETAPYLMHLKPPASCSPIRLDRFSPLYSQSAESGLRRVRPARAYYYVYPLNRRELSRLAYFFEFDYDDGRDVVSYTNPVVAAVQRWWDAWAAPSPPVLDATIAGGTVIVTDTRPVARAARHELSGLPAAVLMHCDQRASWATLTRASELAGAAEADLRDAVDALVADGLLARRGNRFVTLAVFRDRSVQHVSTQHVSTRPRYEEALAEDTAAQAAVPQPLLRLGRSA